MPDVSPTPTNIYYMQRAIELAKKGRFTTRPNPNVGCVIVKNGTVVGEGYHYRAGEPHAEIHALRQAGEHANGATVYVTLEPCNHHGRTPPCADALIHANVAKVVIAVSDPNPKASGGILELQQAGIEVITHVCYQDGYALNRGFFRTMQGGLPYVRLKSACSLDGKIAMQSGESKWITCEQSRQDVQQLRALSGAIITGSQTILADSPQMTVRSGIDVPVADIVQPLLVVLDRRRQIDKASEWYQQQHATRSILLVQQPNIDLHQLLIQLRDDHAIHDVMVEAGAGVSGAFLQAGLVDEWHVYQAPCLLGEQSIGLTNLAFDKMAEQISLKLVSHETLDTDLKLIYQLV